MELNNDKVFLLYRKALRNIIVARVFLVICCFFIGSAISPFGFVYSFFVSLFVFFIMSFVFDVVNFLMSKKDMLECICENEEKHRKE